MSEGLSGQLPFLLLMLVVFFFFIILPQQRRQKKEKNFMRDMKKGTVSLQKVGSMEKSWSSMTKTIPVLWRRLLGNSKLNARQSHLN